MPRRNSRASRPRLKTPAKAKGFTQVTIRPTGVPHFESNIESVIVPVGKCGRKFCFEKEQVEAALKEAQKGHRNSKYKEQRFYACPRCHKYHLTSMERTPNGTA